jgi:hypothetical protein
MKTEFKLYSQIRGMLTKELFLNTADIEQIKFIVKVSELIINTGTIYNLAIDTRTFTEYKHAFAAYEKTDLKNIFNTKN